jgi:diacylglycerol kinase (CTP)
LVSPGHATHVVFSPDPTTTYTTPGILALYLYHLNPPSVRPLITVLCTLLAVVVSADVIRLQSPAFNRVYIGCLGPLMRRSEFKKWNGVIPYLFGIIFVLTFYPREIVVISVLT